MTGPLVRVDQVITAHRDQLAVTGVLSLRAGWLFVDGWPVSPPTPAIVVTTAAGSQAGVRATLPDRIGDVPVDVRAASARKAAALATAGPLARDPGQDVVGADLPPDLGGLPAFSDEIRPDGTPVFPPVAAETVAAATTPQLPYSAPDGVALAAVTGMITVQACASPDAGWPVLKAFLGSVTDTLTIGLYDWTSQHVLDTFTTDLAGRTVNLVLDHPSRNPTADQTDEQTVATLRETLSDHLTQAWALERDDPLAAAWLFPSAYHIKVAVADHQRVWLSSGNWNNSNQPDIDPVGVTGDADAARSGDRDWHVVVESPELAGIFESYLLHDLGVAAAHQVGAAPSVPAQPVVTRPGLQTPPFARFFAPTTVTDPMTITPVLTPDDGSYAPHVTALIASARTTLYLQFQYIELPKDPTTASPGFTGLIAAVVDRQQAGVDVRIIMSEYEVQGYLEQLMTAGLDVAKTVKIQNNVHNKGIVVDASTVLVSSQNWSNAGTSANRDAGVIIADPTLATYFQDLFLHDWDHLSTQAALPD